MLSHYRITIGVLLIGFFLIILSDYVNKFDENGYARRKHYDSLSNNYILQCRKNIRNKWVNPWNWSDTLLDITDSFIKPYSKGQLQQNEIRRYEISRLPAYNSDTIIGFQRQKYDAYLIERNLQTKARSCSYILECSDSVFSYFTEDGKTIKYIRNPHPRSQ